MDRRMIFTALLSVLIGAAAAFYYTNEPSTSWEGAVVAFNSENCPPGWRKFSAAEGRVVIGAGSGAGLTPRSPGETGGSERSGFDPKFATPSMSTEHRTSDPGVIDPDPVAPTTDVLAAVATVDSMPPFVVLTLCVN